MSRNLQALPVPGKPPLLRRAVRSLRNLRSAGVLAGLKPEAREVSACAHDVRQTIWGKTWVDPFERRARPTAVPASEGRGLSSPARPYKRRSVRARLPRSSLNPFPPRRRDMDSSLILAATNATRIVAGIESGFRAASERLQAKIAAEPCATSSSTPADATV
jgi:hypothetical protein